MIWLLRLAEYEFEVKYKRGWKNQQDDAISDLLKNSETVTEDYDDKVFSLDFISLSNYNESLDDSELDFLYVQYADFDHHIARNPFLVETPFEPIDL